MPITIRKASERGASRTEWLDSKHTFSFAEYYDPNHMGFGSLRVINDDRVAPAKGFGRHGHRDMEIVSYVVEGQLEHKDSMGTGSTIVPGDVQRMSAGTGVLHSEFNPSQTEKVRFLQIWIVPEKTGIAPSYEQKRFADDEKRGKLRVVASKDGREGSVTIHQDATIYATLLGRGEEARFAVSGMRRAWVQVVRGALVVNGQALAEGDGAAIVREPEVVLAGASDAAAEALVFDVA